MNRARLLAPLLLLGACREPAAPDPQFVAQWLRTTLAFVRAERLGPPVAARISAYSAIAMYEGYAADPRSRLRSLGGQLNGSPTFPKPRARGTLDGATVAAEAQRVVLDSLFAEGYPSTRRTIDSLARAQIAERADRAGAPTSRRSVEHGNALGHAMLAWAATDGFVETRGKGWSAPTSYALWVNTVTDDQHVPHQLSGESDIVLAGSAAPTMNTATASTRNLVANRPKALSSKSTLPQFNPVRPTEPHWGTLRTFVLNDGDECAPPPPPAYSEQKGSPFWSMGKELYDSVRSLTPEKREIALFWADNPVATGTPGFHWISVLNQMIARRSLSADEAAETYALTAIAIADAFIGCWREKYRSMVVRPVTYLNRVFDPRWQTLFPTPPFPEYPSGHSTLSGAATEVLTALLGDTIAFTDSSQMDIGAEPRAFRNFSHARDEVAISRIYGGIHFVPAVVNGLEQGQCIGRRVLSRLQTRDATR